MTWKPWRSTVAVACAWALTTIAGLGPAWAQTPAPAAGQEYLLGAEDVVAISVWMHPELERTIAIDSDGNITFPPIGEVRAAGLTTTQLANRLGDRLSTYLRQTTTVTVTVSQYLSRSLFVQGAVAKPGRYGFERIPSLVDVISQAGGAVPGADLSQVQVLRRDGEQRRILTVDVASALRGGPAEPMPELRPGDTVIVPQGLGGGMVSTGEAAGVLGAVQKPGLYPVGAGQDLWSVLAAAGGLTERGDLTKIKVITRQNPSPAIFTVNLNQVLEKGTRQPFVIRPGDVVYVKSTGSSPLGRAWNGFATVARDLANIVIVADYVQNLND